MKGNKVIVLCVVGAAAANLEVLSLSGVIWSGVNYIMQC